MLGGGGSVGVAEAAPTSARVSLCEGGPAGRSSVAGGSAGGARGRRAAEDEAALAKLGFRFPQRPASPHCGHSEPRADRAFMRHAFPTPRKAFEYEYGFQIHEDHVRGGVPGRAPRGRGL